MQYLKTSLDLVELKKTLTFFKEMGFSDLYVEQIERDLVEREQRYAQLILSNVI